jgi:rubrerythrin
MEFHNPGFFLKPGMYATAELKAELADSAVLVPDSAVLRSGEKNTVFVALDGGRFEPRTVTLGPRSDENQYQVFAGLEEGERVVVSGQFMLDSESQLREAIQKMAEPGAEPAGEKAAHEAAMAAAASQTAQNSLTNDLGATFYICPMPEHVAITYTHPGKCPICGMTLIPVAEKTLAKMQPGGRVDYYICPMTDNCPVPGHGAVRYDKPGKCPVCGMTLVPVMKAEPPVASPDDTNAPSGHQH